MSHDYDRTMNLVLLTRDGDSEAYKALLKSFWGLRRSLANKYFKFMRFDAAWEITLSAFNEAILTCKTEKSENIYSQLKRAMVVALDEEIFPEIDRGSLGNLRAAKKYLRTPIQPGEPAKLTVAEAAAKFNLSFDLLANFLKMETKPQVDAGVLEESISGIALSEEGYSYTPSGVNVALGVKSFEPLYKSYCTSDTSTEPFTDRTVEILAGIKSDAKREAVEYFIRGFSDTEIGLILGVSEKTVQTRRLRGLEELRV